MELGIWCMYGYLGLLYELLSIVRVTKVPVGS